MRQVASYYNPSWGRFINADGTLGEAGDLLGNNMCPFYLTQTSIVFQVPNVFIFLRISN